MTTPTLTRPTLPVSITRTPKKDYLNRETILVCVGSVEFQRTTAGVKPFSHLAAWKAEGHEPRMNWEVSLADAQKWFEKLDRNHLSKKGGSIYLIDLTTEELVQVKHG